MGAVPRKPGGISLGDDQATRTQSAAMSEWSDDNGAPVAPPPSTEVPLRNMHVEVQSKRGEGVLEQQAEERPTVRAVGHPAQGTWVDPEPCLGAREGSNSLELSTGKPTCKYPCLGVSCCPIFIVVVIDKLI